MGQSLGNGPAQPRTTPVQPPRTTPRTTPQHLAICRARGRWRESALRNEDIGASHGWPCMLRNGACHATRSPRVRERGDACPHVNLRSPSQPPPRRPDFFHDSDCGTGCVEQMRKLHRSCAGTANSCYRGFWEMALKEGRSVDIITWNEDIRACCVAWLG